MKEYIVVVAILHAALAGHLSRFSVQMPYLHPADVTYRSSPPPGVLTAGPAFRTTPVAAGTTSVAYGPLASAALTSSRFLVPAAPLFAQQYSAAPLLHDPYTALPPLPSARYHAPLAQVDTVHHVPGVADIPVTRYEAQPGYIQNVVDVAKAKVATRKIEVRRAAIEKTFYDIEERIIVRPAGSAVVELNQPLSETQKGPTIISLAEHPIHVPSFPLHLPPAVPSPVLPAPESPPAPENADQFVDNSLPIADAEFDDSDSIAVDNPEISGRSQNISEQGTSQPEQETRQAQEQEQNEGQNEQQSISERMNGQEETEPNQDKNEPDDQRLGKGIQFQQSQQLFQNQLNQILNQFQMRNQLFRQIEEQMIQLRQQFTNQNELLQNDKSSEQQQDSSTTQPEESSTAQSRESPSVAQNEQSPTLRASKVLSQPLFRSALDGQAAQPLALSRSSDVIKSVQNLTPEQLQENQQRLIALLTATGGVTEVGFGRSGVSISPAGDAGQIKARVLSVTPAPDSAEPSGERVHTRRIVVSRPIQTVQEVDVVEPFTKLERVEVHQPAILKTAKIDIARVHTSVPVLSKTLTPAVPLAVVHR